MDINVLIGVKIRRKRLENSWSQKVLAEKLGISYQQVQKYELGTNQVSPSRLIQLCDLFEENITFFFYQNEPEEIVNEALIEEDRNTAEIVGLFKGLSVDSKKLIIELAHKVN